jgi:hypothetical protein
MEGRRTGDGRETDVWGTESGYSMETESGIEGTESGYSMRRNQVGGTDGQAKIKESISDQC